MLIFDSSISKTKVTDYLPEFISTHKKFYGSLKNLGFSNDQLFEFLVVYLLEKKLDPITKRAYEQSKDTDELPSKEEFFKFLEKRRTVNENLTYVESSMTSSGTTHRKKPYENTTFFSSIDKGKVFPFNCLFCKEFH